ncbi:MAG TPA: hypothetical protein DHV44_16220 [Providencia sp.]|nr:hypothetical protein [Providencia sp.]
MMQLFICMTILQLRIVGKLLEKKENKDSAVLFLGDLTNTKNQFFLEKYINNKCVVCSYDLNKFKPQRPFKTFKRDQYAKDIVKILPTKNYDCVYLANVDVTLVHHILSKIAYQRIRTFDDGAFNLLNERRVTKPSLYKKLTHYFQGRRLHEYDLIKNTELHYTIFKQEKENIEYVPFINCPQKVEQSNKVSILLGTVYAEISNDVPVLLSQLDNFITNTGIEYYIPHPRDLTNYFSNIEYINSPQSAEDIIIDLIERGYFVEIYGFFSTTQFILSSSDAVKNYTFRFTSMDNGYERLESALAQNAVNFITVDISK